jgi:hypothetical protein
MTQVAPVLNFSLKGRKQSKKKEKVIPLRAWTHPQRLVHKKWQDKKCKMLGTIWRKNTVIVTHTTNPIACKYVSESTAQYPALPSG